MMNMSKNEYAIRNAKIVEFAKAGMSARKISIEFGLSPVRITQILDANHIERRRINRKWTNESRRKFTDEQLKDLIDKECSFKECAIILGVDPETVRARAHKLGIDSPARVNADKIAKMYELRDCGYTNIQIGKRIGMSEQTVRRHIGAQPEEINEQSHILRGKKRSASASAVKAARKAMIDKREAERISAIEAERIRVEEMLREEERMSVQNTLTEILGFEHIITTAEEGRELIMRIASKFEMKAAA